MKSCSSTQTRSWRGWAIKALLAVCLASPIGWGDQAYAWELPKQAQFMGSTRKVESHAGESLYELARRYGYALEHLAAANHLSLDGNPSSPETVMLPSLRILPRDYPKDGVVINLAERGGYVFQGDVITFFPIAIGKPGRFQTPTGSFTIFEKVKDPDWVAPAWAGLGEDNVVKAGPDNPLGDRWIGLSLPGLGMHSTNAPSTVGQAVSHGCLRMYPEVARSIFSIVRTGWPVRIEYETTRLGLKREGIFVSAFPDVYDRGSGLDRLRPLFEQEDLLGFYDAQRCDKVLDEETGLAVKVVDLLPKAWVEKKGFPAARLGSELFIEQGALEALGVECRYSLSDRVVKLQKGDQSVNVPLYLPNKNDRTAKQAFLARGSGWFPARDVLSRLGFSLRWEGSENRLRIEGG